MMVSACEEKETNMLCLRLPRSRHDLTGDSGALMQDLGYAKLANLPPVNGLCKFLNFLPAFHLCFALTWFFPLHPDSSFVPPLVYAVLGSSLHSAIGPVAVVSLVLGNLLVVYYDPTISKTSASGVVTTSTNPLYYDLAITATFFAGAIQMAMGIFR